MALALYRRYRPDTFSGVIGQDQVTVPLSRALDAHTLTHAYLFSGPRGCGKTSCARILARCMNCEQGPTSQPCGVCQSCRDLSTSGAGSLDVVEIDAASHNGVDDARELRERASFAPVSSRYKIFILDEAHMVTPQGFNALLKIVEEPPEHVKFIFATTEPEKVISTIRSRTHHYPFRLVAPEIMGPYLQTVCDQEKITLDSGVLRLVMRAGGGSVRDSLSVLDQLMAGADHGVIAYDSAVALLGFTPEQILDKVVEGLIEYDGGRVYSAVSDVLVGGFDPRKFVEDLLQRMRDLLLILLSGGAAKSILDDEWLQQDAQYDHLVQYAQALGASRISAIAEIVNETLSTMTGVIPPRMRLELMMAKLLITGSKDGKDVQSLQDVAVKNIAEHTQDASAKLAQEDGEVEQAQEKLEDPIPQQVVPQQSENLLDPELLSQKELDTAWDNLTESLPIQVRELIDREHVPVVSYQRPSATVHGRIVMMFDQPLSQYAFALAVSASPDDEEEVVNVPAIVLKKVKEVFGDNTIIAPAGKTINGEIVEPVTTMEPAQRVSIKRAIATAKTQRILSQAAVDSQNQQSSTQSTQRSRAHRKASTQVSGDTSSDDDRGSILAHNRFIDDEDIWLQPGNMLTSPGKRESSSEVVGSAGVHSVVIDSAVDSVVESLPVADFANTASDAPIQTEDHVADNAVWDVGSSYESDQEEALESLLQDDTFVPTESSDVNVTETSENEDDYSFDDEKLDVLASGAKAVTSVFSVSDSWTMPADAPESPFAKKEHAKKEASNVKQE